MGWRNRGAGRRARRTRWDGALGVVYAGKWSSGDDGQRRRNRAAVGCADGRVDVFAGQSSAAKPNLGDDQDGGRMVVLSETASPGCGNESSVTCGRSFGNVGPVLATAFFTDGRRIVTTGADGTVRIWDGRSGSDATWPSSAGVGGGVFARRMCADRKSRRNGGCFTTRSPSCRCRSRGT